ncbi:MAG: hypothetical protein AMXMBFR84_17080 [Candidatus Hydrogenedentota bacterium]
MLFLEWRSVYSVSGAILFLGSALCFQPTIALAQTIPPEWQNLHSEPMGLKHCGDFVYFSADDGVHGREPWRTDGTPEGTVMIADLQLGSEGSNPENFVEAGRWTVFLATRDSAPLLWVTDGTPGNIYTVEGEPGRAIWCEHVIGAPFGVLGHEVYFPSRNNSVQMSMWIFDLNSRSLRRFEKPSFLPTQLDYPKYFESAEDRIYYVWGRNDYHEGQLFTLNSGGDQVLLTSSLGPNVRCVLTCVGDRLYFAASTPETGIEVWTCDGTPSSTRILQDINPGPGEALSVVHPYGAALGDLLVFRANDGIHGDEIWVTNGTSSGTFMLRDVNPGSGSSNCGMLTTVGRLCYFQANDGISGAELWTTDGTPEGTRLVKDVFPGPRGSNPFGLLGIGDKLYFSAEDHLRGGELWQSDGTADGTMPVIDLAPGIQGGWAKHKAVLNGKILFGAGNPSYGVELWSSDGTSQGTTILKDIWPVRGPNPSSNPDKLISVGNRLFFVVNDATHGAELWQSDGTHEGTGLVKDIFPGATSSSPSHFCAFEGLLYFQADDGSHGSELWCSDGTDKGTRLCVDLREGRDSANPHSITSVGERLAFVANDGVSGYELYRYPPVNLFDRLLVKDIRAGNDGSNPKNLTVHQGKLYFVADDGIHGQELWVSNLEPSGTHIVRDLLPRPKMQSQAQASTIHLDSGSAVLNNSLFLLGDQDGALPVILSLKSNVMETYTVGENE